MLQKASVTTLGPGNYEFHANFFVQFRGVILTVRGAQLRILHRLYLT